MKPVNHKLLQLPTIVNSLELSVFKQQQGFTLIELMISLLLGLLISAAALQVFYTSSVNSRRQQASSQLQENAIFGFSQIQQHLRRANYGAKSANTYHQYFMNHLTPQGGVVLTAPDGSRIPNKWLEGNLSGLVLNGAAIEKTLLSSSASANSISNLNGIKNSDQLTIQYQSAQDTTFNCEGTAIPKDFYVIERYFVRIDNSVSPAATGLACASAVYNYDEMLAGNASGIDIKDYILPATTTIKNNNLAGAGTIIIANVDYFRVLLGVSTSSNFATDPDHTVMGYMPIPSVVTALDNRRIVSVQLGILARSDNPTATSQANNNLSFKILDKVDRKLNSAAIKGPTYLRNVYESTVLLRNARGGL